MSLELQFALLALAVWRLTHLLAEEDGPAEAILRLRKLLGRGVLGRAMDCFQCLSVWIAAPSALLLARDLGSWVLIWLALSGAACLLERWTAAPTEVQVVPAVPAPAMGGSNGMLWAGTAGAARVAGSGSVASADKASAAAPESAAAGLPR